MSAFKELTDKIKEHNAIRETDGSDPIVAVEVGQELWGALLPELEKQGSRTQEDAKGFFIELATAKGSIKVRATGGLLPRQIVTFG